MSVVADWTAEERAAVGRLRGSVKGRGVEGWSEGFFLRFLRSKGGDEAAAAAALAETAVFRAAWGLDRPLDAFPLAPVQKELNKFTYPGVADRQGNPVVLALFGAQDVKGLTEASNAWEYILYSLFCLEKGARLAEDAAKSQGKPYAQCTMVMDMEGMTSEHYTLKAFTNSFLTINSIQDQHFPLPYGKILCIKAPTAFTYAYSLATPFLGADITDVIELPGAEWAERVQALIEPSKWPKAWGGELDEAGPDFPSTPVLPLPESRYLTDGPEAEVSSGTEVTVYPGVKHSERVEGVRAGAVLRFAYKTSGEDVGFGVRFEREAGETEVLFPSVRLECARLPVKGSLVLPWDGNYVVEFDNEYSWFSAKELTFSLKLDD